MSEAEGKTHAQWIAEARLILDGATWLQPRREHLLALQREYERREMKRSVISLGLAQGDFP